MCRTMLNNFLFFFFKEEIITHPSNTDSPVHRATSTLEFPCLHSPDNERISEKQRF